MTDHDRLIRTQEIAIDRGFKIIDVQARCIREVAAELRRGIHGGNPAPELAREILKIIGGGHD